MDVLDCMCPFFMDYELFAAENISGQYASIIERGGDSITIWMRILFIAENYSNRARKFQLSIRIQNAID